jgi:hypothetical protein
MMMRRFSPFVLATLAACGGGNSGPDASIVIPDAPADAAPDSPPPPDAQEFDFSCENDPPATTAPATITIAGSVNDIDLASQMQVPVSGATVNAFRNGTAQPIATATSDNNGAFSLPLTTGGTPIDGFIESSKAGHHTVRIYPPNPLIADQANLPALMLNNTAFGLIGMFAGTSPDAGIIILDCAGTPIAGATLTVKQGGQDVGTIVDGSQLQPGLFFVGDLAAGDTVVGATFNGHTLRSHTVVAANNTLVTTVVTPRP